MSTRIIQPTPPYNLPVGFSQAIVPAPYNPNDATAEVVERGSFWLQPGTKSTFQAPQAFYKTDTCGNDYYKKGSVSASINKLQNCEIVSTFLGSLTCTIPVDMTPSEFNLHIEALANELWQSTLATNFVDLT